MPQRFIVTGGCGFIGSHLAEKLIADGATVVVLDNLSTGSLTNLPIGAKLIIGDVQDRASLEEAVEGCDGIFHLAAIASVPKCTENWLSSHRVNLSASIRLFEIASFLKIPVVYASSSAIYGNAKQIPIAEDDPKKPVSIYGADKYAMELHAFAGAETKGLRSFGMRFFNIYGPRQDPSSPYSGVISIFMQNALYSDPISVNGTGQQVRDFVYVLDAVACCTAAMSTLMKRKEGFAEISNVCTGRGTTINDLAATLIDLTRADSQLVHRQARDGDIVASIGNPDRLKELLGIECLTSLDVGIRGLLRAREVEILEPLRRERAIYVQTTSMGS